MSSRFFRFTVSLLTISLMLLVLSNCTKKSTSEITKENNWAFINSFIFTDTEPLTDYYIKGTVDNVPFAYTDGKDSVIYRSSVASVVDFHGNQLSPPTTTGAIAYSRAFEFNHYHTAKSPTGALFRLLSPSSSQLVKVDSILRNYFAEKKELYFSKYQYAFDPLSTAADSLGFVLDFTFYFGNFYDSGTAVNSAAGGDQSGSYLKIKDVKLNPGIDIDYYDVTFSFQCKLYYSTDPTLYYKTIKDGEMRVQIILPHK